MTWPPLHALVSRPRSDDSVSDCTCGDPHPHGAHERHHRGPARRVRNPAGTACRIRESTGLRVRNQAWKLRHLELQLRTLNPFLAGLEDVARKSVLADLALRFFSGHEGVVSNSENHGGETVSLDAEQLLALLMRVQPLGATSLESQPVMPPVGACWLSVVTGVCDQLMRFTRCALPDSSKSLSLQLVF